MDRRSISTNVAVIGMVVLLVVGFAAGLGFIATTGSSKTTTVTQVSTANNSVTETVQGQPTTEIISSQGPTVTETTTSISNVVTTTTADLTDTVVKYSTSTQYVEVTSTVTDSGEIAFLMSELNFQQNVSFVNGLSINEAAGGRFTMPINTNDSGYLTVLVRGSTSSDTFVQCLWNAYGMNYEQAYNVGSSGSAVFPVFVGSQGSNIQVNVSNGNGQAFSAQVTILENY